MQKTLAFFLLPASLFLLWTWDLGAQNFTPMNDGEYQVVQEPENLHPGMRFSGGYRGYWSSRRSGLLDRAGGTSYFGQNLEVTGKSIVNQHLSVNATLTNRDDSLSEQDQGMEADNASEASPETKKGMEVILDQAYLEYMHNPNASLKVGRHQVEMADRDGLVYTGTATGISQICRIGTWCYDAGAIKLDETAGDQLIWASLKYPVYETGQTWNDRWSNQEAQKEAFYVEIFRAYYVGNGYPLARSGGWTGNNSQAQATTEAGDPVYFDNRSMEYGGLFLDWNYQDFLFDLTWIFLYGDRTYYALVNDTRSDLTNQSVSGSLYRLDFGYLASQDWKISYSLFSSTGNPTSQKAHYWEDDSTQYLEVDKGNYDRGLIYFRGVDEQGDRHGVGNLRYGHLGLSYRSLPNDIGFDVDLLAYYRNKAVYDQEGDQQDQIGAEIDARIFWTIDGRLVIDGYAGLFRPWAAYSPSDNDSPTQLKSDIALVGFGLGYQF